MLNNKKYLILSDDIEFTNNIKNSLITYNVKNKNIYNIDNPIDTIKFYNLFHKEIDIIIIDDLFEEKTSIQQQIENLNLNNNFEGKPTLIIKKPFSNDLFINFLLENNNEEEIKNFFTNTVINNNYDKLDLIKENFWKMKNLNSIEELNKFVDLFYLQSFQTQTHIKNILNYTDYFTKQIYNHIVILQEQYNENKKIEKVEIFENHLNLFFPDILKNNDLEKLLNDKNNLKKVLDKERWKVVLGSFFHDIGKNFISKELLDSEKVYDDNDRMIMANHSKYGVYFLNILLNEDKENQEYYNMIIDITKEHHEKHNDIRSESKLVKMIDVFEALASMRSYKPVFLFSDIKKIIFEKEKKDDEFFSILSEQFLDSENDFYAIYLNNTINNKEYYNKILILENYEIITSKTKEIIEKSIKNILTNLSSFNNPYQKESKEMLKNIKNILNTDFCFNINNTKLFDIFDKKILEQFNNKFITFEIEISLSKKIDTNKKKKKFIEKDF